LRVFWLNEFGRSAPKHLNRYLLFRVLAYRVQALRLGDLDSDIRKSLERVSSKDRYSSIVSTQLTKVDQKRFAPPPGTVLVREWDRKSHQVIVLAGGYSWNGNTFDSLSQIAFAITGTKWNGPRFFGLRDRQPQMSAGDVE
jgi:hypothetical protein